MEPNELPADDTVTNTQETKPDNKAQVVSLLTEIKVEGQDVEAIKELFKLSLVTAERHKRADQLTKVYNKIEEKKKEINKIRPDQSMGVDENGVEEKKFSKESFDKLQKAKKELEKMEQAFAEALLTGKFDKANSI